MSYESAMEELMKKGIVPSDSSKVDFEAMFNENDKYSGLSPAEREAREREDSIIENLQRTVGIEYSSEQDTIIRHKGSMCILACAGSGKTSVLTHLLTKRILTGEIRDTSKVVCTTYSKAGADEMNDRLQALLDKFGVKTQLKIKTLHAFYLELIRTFGITSDVIKDSKRKKFILESCKEAGYICRDDDLNIIDSLLSYQINCLLSDTNTVASQVNTIEDLTVEQYTKIRKGYDIRKRKENLIDFDDMQTYLYKWLCKDVNSSDENTRNLGISVRNYCKAMWTEFYIDEAQDVSKIQFEIVKAIVTSDKKLDRNLVFIGDDEQCIYTWRGAEPSIILSITPMFGIPTFALSTNYRCKKNIVDYASKGIKYCKVRYNKSMNSDNIGGSVRIASCKRGNLFDMSKIAFDYINELLKNRVKATDIAVMSRNNFHLAILNNMLLEKGVYCNITNDMKMTNSSMYKDLKAIIDITEPTWKPQVTRDILWKLCVYLGVKGANFIAQFQENAALSLNDTLGFMLKSYGNFNNINFNKNLSIPEAVKITGAEQWKRLSTETINAIFNLYGFMELEPNKAKAFKGMCMLYREGSAFLYKTSDRQRAISSLIDYLTDMIDRNGLEETKKFLKVTEQLEQGTMAIPGPKVNLTTIHSAKGKEWKHVIMFACDNLTMPGIDSIGMMLDKGESIADINKYIDEERRLHYVESTRAKEDLLIISRQELSVFTLEALGFFENNEKFKEVEGKDDNTSKMLEASARIRASLASNKDTESNEMSRKYDTNSFIIRLAQKQATLDDSIEFVSKIVDDKSSPYYFDGTVR